jgi:hypothetical protein
MATIDYLDYIPQSILSREITSNFGKLWTIFSEQLDELLVQVAYGYTLYIINDMSGKNLDQIGNIVKCEREGAETDADYRISLMIAIARNISSGSIPDILSICTLIKQGDITKVVRIQEIPPARFQLFTNMVELIGDSVEILEQSRGAGIGMNISYAESLYPFVFAGDTTGKGFGDSHMTDGGEFSQSA